MVKTAKETKIDDNVQLFLNKPTDGLNVSATYYSDDTAAANTVLNTNKLQINATKPGDFELITEKIPSPSP
jgi:hypothetical protein